MRSPSARAPALKDYDQQRTSEPEMSLMDTTAVMPLEILAHTLNYASHEDLMRAATVSKHWRSAASICDEFYQSFSLYSHILNPEDAQVDRWCSHVSATAPQPLNISIHDYISVTESNWSVAIFQQIMERLVTILPRIKVLACWLEDDNRLSMVLNHLANAKVPLLRSLEILRVNREGRQFCLSAALLELNAPALRYLRLYYVLLDPASSTLFRHVERLEVISCNFSLCAALCGQFPSLRWMMVHDGSFTEQSHPSVSIRPMAITTLNTMSIYISTPADDIWFQIDFSSVRDINIAGIRSLAPFIPQHEWAELCTVYDTNHPMTADASHHAMVRIKFHSGPRKSRANDDVATRSVTLAFNDKRCFQPAVHEIEIVVPILQNLTTVELVHQTLCELLAFARSLPRMVRILDNIIDQDTANALWPTEGAVAQCPALQELHLFSHNWSPSEQVIHDSIVINHALLTGFVSELGIANRGEQQKPRLFLVGIKVVSFESGDDSCEDYRDAFSKIEEKTYTSCQGCASFI